MDNIDAAVERFFGKTSREEPSVPQRPRIDDRSDPGANALGGCLERWRTEPLRLALGRGGGHHRVYFAEDRADAGCNIRHDGSSRNCDKSGHERVFDEILTTSVFPHPYFQEEVFHEI
jgi:hypothetical protein